MTARERADRLICGWCNCGRERRPAYLCALCLEAAFAAAVAEARESEREEIAKMVENYGGDYFCGGTVREPIAAAIRARKP